MENFSHNGIICWQRMWVLFQNLFQIPFFENDVMYLRSDKGISLLLMRGCEKMKRELMLGLMIVIGMTLISIPVSAVNPHENGPGRPNMDCEALFASGALFPHGFNSGGFANAADHYAGSGFTANGNNPKAVSQYDVACFEQYQRLFG
jgi:hypothetical protein